MLNRRRQVAENDLHLSPEQIVQRGWNPAIRHVGHVGTGHHFEQLASHMGR
jgi:hypothetical protein